MDWLQMLFVFCVTQTKVKQVWNDMRATTSWSEADLPTLMTPHVESNSLDSKEWTLDTKEAF